MCASPGTMLSRFRLALLAAAAAVCAACTAPPAEEAVDVEEQHWDSADGNPTHATHTILAEYAIKSVKGEVPEVNRFSKEIIEGANLELHDLKHEKFEALRLEVGGNNWAAEHPELLWQKAQASYAAGDKSKAYFYVGILLHYVQDMGVPAHAFHVIHQSGPSSWDHVELLAFFRFRGDLTGAGPADPKLDGPIPYIEFSAESARVQFRSTYPGKTFIKDRETHVAKSTAYALRAAAIGFTKPAKPAKP
jgi:hypothetical protein